MTHIVHCRRRTGVIHRLPVCEAPYSELAMGGNLDCLEKSLDEYKLLKDEYKLGPADDNVSSVASSTYSSGAYDCTAQLLYTAPNPVKHQ